MSRVLVAGLGDTGLLTAIGLSRHAEVVGVSVKPGLVSGQELGIRLTRPERWARDYHLPFDRFRRLDPVRTVHGTLLGVDLATREVSVELADGTRVIEPYDVLVIATGVTNGFWRRPVLQTHEQVEEERHSHHRRLERAARIAVVGGGAAAVGTALNLAARWPGKSVSLHYPGTRALPHHHPRVWERVAERLRRHGVTLAGGHRAEVPADHEQITEGPVTWSTGQPPTSADAVVWAIGRVRPNTGWLPAELLDENGFVRVDPDLSIPHHPGLFAIGDVAATDPLRTSARNRADKLLVHNVRAHLAGRPTRAYRPPRGRWGSVLGVQPDGLTVFAPTGFAFRFPRWTIDTVLQPWIVRRGIYRGVRRR